jgi:hypothetical protein
MAGERGSGETRGTLGTRDPSTVAVTTYAGNCETRFRSIDACALPERHEP